MKYMYKDVRTPIGAIKSNLLKTMVLDLCEGVEMEELYTAISKYGKDGIFCSTRMGGKKFWEVDELTELFVRKNKEKKRFRL